MLLSKRLQYGYVAYHSHGVLHQPGIEVCFHHPGMLVDFNIAEVTGIAADEIILQYQLNDPEKSIKACKYFLCLNWVCKLARLH